MWTASWKERYACLFDDDPPVICKSKKDLLLWKLKDGSLFNFSVGNVWSVIRDYNDSCVWSNVVWFSQCIPRLSFFFFDCPFAKSIWARMKDLSRLHFAPYKLPQIIDFFHMIPINKSIWSVIQRLVLGASIYYIWQERNARIFGDQARSIDAVCDLIQKTVRLKFMGLGVKWSPQVMAGNVVWDFYMKEGYESCNFRR